jgi:hypothetical protein
MKLKFLSYLIQFVLQYAGNHRPCLVLHNGVWHGHQTNELSSWDKYSCQFCNSFLWCFSKSQRPNILPPCSLHHTSWSANPNSDVLLLPLSSILLSDNTTVNLTQQSLQCITLIYSTRKMTFSFITKCYFHTVRFCGLRFHTQGCEWNNTMCCTCEQ